MNWYKIAWNKKLSEKPKLELYSKIKDDYKCEKYLKLNMTKHKRSLLCNLRLGTLGLEIELGRHARLLRKDRICKICKLEVESELHFLFICNKFKFC